jgi:hypothetical protein
MLILNPLKKCQKDSFKKVINEKGTEKRSFSFTVCKSFQTITSFG